MNVLDVFLCLALLFGIFKGIKQGFFVALASLVSILLGILIAIKCSHLMKGVLEHHGFAGNQWIEVLAFALTFLAVIVGVTLLAKFFTSVADFANLGWINTLFGGVFGLLKSMLILSILLNLLQRVNANHALLSAQTTASSRLMAPVQKVSQLIYPAVADWFAVFQSEAFDSKPQ